MTPDQAPEPTPTPTPEPAPEPAPAPTPEPAAPVAEPAPAAPAATLTGTPASEQPLFANNNGAKKSHTGLIIGIILAVVAIAAVLIVLFVVILPNANKDNNGGNNNGGTSQNGGGNGGENGGGNGGENGGGNGGENGGGNGGENGGGNGGENGGGINVSSSVVGKYEIYSMIGSDGEESTTEVDWLKQLGASYTVEFKADGTGTIIVDYSESPFYDEEEMGEATQTESFTWKADGTVTGKDEDGELSNGNWTLSSDGKYVSISADGQTIKFVRK